MENRLLFGIYVVLGFYILYKLYELMNKPTSYKDEVDKILSSEKYKVKGRFED